jgi:DNA primase catalytic core
MARLSDAEVNKLKTEISLLRLVESQGHESKKQGNDYVISCPFHEEDTPSLIISPKNNLFHCFGCDAAGSVIDWVMKTRGVSFRFACEILQEDAGLIAESGTKTVHRDTATKLAAPFTLKGTGAADASNQEALRNVLDYYHQTLKQSPEALEYLTNRGLAHPELIDTFKLGYANRTLGYRLPEKNRKAGKELRGQLQEIGLLRSSGHEHFNGSLIVPVVDENGQTTEVYGRKVRQDLRKGTPLHLYLPGQHHGVWNCQALAACDEVILCEALIDAMTFWVNGYRNVTASYGMSGFTDDHLAAFKANDIKRVLIAYDRDDSGNAAAEKLGTLLNDNGMDAFRIMLPKGMDVNEYALQVKPAAKSLGVVIRKAQWLGNGKAPLITTQGIDDAALPVCQTQIVETENLTPLAADLPEPTTASPVPDAPKTIEAEVGEREVTMVLGDRHYRVRGLQKNMSYDQLKINLLVTNNEHIHIDTFDLYASRPRQAFINQASVELGVQDDVIKHDLGKVLLKLEELQDAQIKTTLEPQEKGVTLSAEEQAQALELLQDKSLLSRILEDFKTAGVVGEETNKLVGYLACVSRKLDKPLAIIIQSSSAAGKSSLMDAILNLMPEEERVQYSAMTGQSLFYMGETNLKHKILAIAEEEGADTASYALKLLQSEGELTIASTGKDESSGNLVTKEYHVEGPVMLFLTTTAIDIDEELMNRCTVLTVNESREQTQAIHAMQRSQQTLEGLLKNEDKKKVIELHRNAQRLLRPLLVANPFAEQLTFIDDKTRTRRDHMKYLTLIRAITLLHQYQRELKTVNHHGQTLSYIDVTKEDIEIANRLAHEVLGRSLDELPPHTRTLLTQVHRMVGTECQAQSIETNQVRFSRRDVREFVGWTDFQIKKHMSRLQDMEYVLVHRGGRGQSFEYELLYQGEGQSGQPFLLGLSDMNNLQYDDQTKPLTQNNEPLSRPQGAAKKPRSSAPENGVKPQNIKDSEKLLGNALKNTAPLKNGVASRNRNASHPSLAAQ